MRLPLISISLLNLLREDSRSRVSRLDDDTERNAEVLIELIEFPANSFWFFFFLSTSWVSMTDRVRSTNGGIFFSSSTRSWIKNRLRLLFIFIQPNKNVSRLNQIHNTTSIFNVKTKRRKKIKWNSPFRDTSSSTRFSKFWMSGGSLWISLSLKPSFRSRCNRKKFWKERKKSEILKNCVNRSLACINSKRFDNTHMHNIRYHAGCRLFQHVVREAFRKAQRHHGKWQIDGLRELELSTGDSNVLGHIRRWGCGIYCLLFSMTLMGFF